MALASGVSSFCRYEKGRTMVRPFAFQICPLYCVT
jgi:hypothetical protein